MFPKRLRPQITEGAPEDLPPAKLAKHISGNKDHTVVPQPAGSEKNSGRPCTPPSTHSSAVKDTPYRRSSSHPCSVPKQLSHSSQNRSVVETLPAGASQEAAKRHGSFDEASRTAKQMEAILQAEVDGAIYEYPALCDEFFSVDRSHLDGVLGKIVENDILWRHNGQWFIETPAFPNEDHDMHRWFARLLDTIMHAAFQPTQFRPSAQAIVPNLESRMAADHKDDARVSPDIVQGLLGEGGARHWGDLEFFAECKATNGRSHTQGALMQIARYSRALFTHQIYRRHIYSIAICGTEATFVRISRGHILHSPAIDLTTKAEQFIHAVAGLFMLDDFGFGYNTLFYYWPPLRNEVDQTDRQLRVQTGKWRWVIVEILCHRMCLIGRATVVLLLRRVGHPEHYAVLKLIWRPDTRTDESESLAWFEGNPGVCQCRWSHCDESTKVLHPDLLRLSPFRSHFVCTKEGEPEASTSGPHQESGTAVEVNGQIYRSQDIRHYSMILMDEGVSLWRIQNLVHLLRVLRDGIVACASITDQGKVHRDISAGNILCLPRDITSPDKDLWDEPSNPDSDEAEMSFLDESPDRYNFGDTSFLIPEEAVGVAFSVGQYIKQRYVKQSPLGRLFDFEFMVPEDREENQVGSCADRTGTLAFMSARILHAKEENPVVHDFLDDLESFFWVLLWIIFTRAKISGGLSKTSKDNFRDIFLGSNAFTSKKLFILDPFTYGLPMIQPLVLTTGWEGVDLVVCHFCLFLHKHQYPQPAPEISFGKHPVLAGLGPQVPRAKSQKEKWEVLSELIQIFDKAILTFQK